MWNSSFKHPSSTKETQETSVSSSSSSSFEKKKSTTTKETTNPVGETLKTRDQNTENRNHKPNKHWKQEIKTLKNKNLIQKVTNKIGCFFSTYLVSKSWAILCTTLSLSLSLSLFFFGYNVPFYLNKQLKQVYIFTYLSYLVQDMS